MAKAKRRNVVAVVDDDIGMREATISLLEAAGFSACGYASAEELLRSPLGQSAFCLVLDMHLPAMSGIQLYHELRARGLAPAAVLVTANDSARLRAEALECGMLGALCKPFAGQDLIELVRCAVRQHRSR
jgi:FixJ family two-component response regulator